MSLLSVYLLNAASAQTAEPAAPTVTVAPVDETDAVDEPTPEEQAALEEGKRLYDMATLWYEEGQYDRALEAFNQAYALTQLGDILFNIANVQERAGQLQEAVDSLEKYRLYASDEEGPTIRRRILSLEERIREEEAEAAATAAPVVQDPVVTQPATPPQKQPRWSWVAVGGTSTAVFGGAALASYVGTRQALDNGNRDAYATWRTTNNVSLALAGAGAVLTAAGLLWQTSDAPSLQVSASPTHATFTYRF